jgi:hypothetical protein
MNGVDRMSPQQQRKPNYVLMQSSKDTINRATVEITLDFSESLQAKLKRLNTALDAAHSSILQSTVTMVPLLNNANYRSLCVELDSLSANQGLESALLKQFQRELVEDYISSVNSDMRRVRDLWVAMTTKIAQVGDIKLAAVDDAVLVNSANLEKGIRQDLENLDKRLAEVNEQRKEIDDLIKVIDDKNLFDLLLPWIASDEELNDLNLSAPQVEIVKRGVRLVRKLVEHVSQHIRYTEMVKLRDDLRARRQHYQNQKDQQTQLLASVLEKAQALTRLSQLEPVRVDYVREAESLAGHIGGFVTAFDLPSDTSLETLSAITAQGVALQKKLEPIAAAWHSR